MKIAVLGSGLFATALSSVLADNGHEPLMWTLFPDSIHSINELHFNHLINYTKKLNDKIKASLSLKEVLNISDIVVISVPSYEMEDVLNKITKIIKNDSKKYIFINTAKGFHPQTGKFMSELMNDLLPAKNVNLISSIVGPSYAIEILNKNITQVNLLALDNEYSQKLLKLFNNKYFKLNIEPNIKAAEFLSGYKNVVALMSGMINEYKFTINTYSAFITKAIQEAKLILKLLKLNEDTIISLAGIGDLILTCGSNKSRNFQAGQKIAKLDSFNNALLNLKKMNITVEGIGSIFVIKKIFEKNKIDLENTLIINALVKIASGQTPIKNIIESVLCS